MTDRESKIIRDCVDEFKSSGRKIAILDFNTEETDKIYFNELWQAIQQLAAGLKQHGLEKGETIMFLASNSLNMMIAILAAIYAGAVAAPIDLQADDEVLSHVLDDSSAKLIFLDDKGFERINSLKNKSGIELIRLDKEDDKNYWRNFLQDDNNSKFDDLSEDDQAVLFYTSGTTGLPKGVPLSHKNIVTQMKAVQATELLNKKDKILLPLPLFHVYPFVIGFLVPLYLGLNIVVPKAITGPEIIKAIKEGEATVLIAVPRLLRALYAAIENKARSNNIDKNAFDFASGLSLFLNSFGINLGKKLFTKVHKRFPTLRLLSCGGALLEPEIARKLIALGWDIAIGYGLTETSPLLTIRLPNNKDLKSVGKPISGVQIRIQKGKNKSTDNEEKSKKGKAKEEDQKRSLESDEEQPEIQAKGDNIFSGYRNLPDKTKETFTEDGWFKTGDTGYFHFGNLRITGRISTLLKSEGGKKIQPEELEKEYEKDPVIREIGILQNKQQQLVALVVPNVTAVGKTDPHEKIGQVIKTLSVGMPSYSRLSDFAITNQQLPRTNLGKVRRHDLIDVYEKAKESENGKSKGGSEEESAEDKALLKEPIAKATWDWLHERFPEAQISFNKSPQLDLNVDSLEWLNLTLELQERLGVELSEEAIARVDTVRDLIKEVIEAAKSGTKKISPFDEPEKIIDEDQKAWLKPLSPFMLQLATLLYWANFILARLCFRVSAIGLEHIPKEQVIFTPNHSSYLDAFMLTAVLDIKTLHKTQWAGWAGIALHNPFNAFIYRLSQAIPIEPKRSLLSSLALASAVLKKHRNLVWFPEGELTPSGKLLPFKSGIGTLLLHYPVKVVPMRIVGTYEALPHGALFPHFNKTTVIFGEPVSTEDLLKEGKGEDDAQKIASALHDRVQKLHTK